MAEKKVSKTEEKKRKEAFQEWVRRSDPPPASTLPKELEEGSEHGTPYARAMWAENDAHKAYEHAMNLVFAAQLELQPAAQEYAEEKRKEWHKSADVLSATKRDVPKRRKGNTAKDKKAKKPDYTIWNTGIENPRVLQGINQQATVAQRMKDMADAASPQEISEKKSGKATTAKGVKAKPGAIKAVKEPKAEKSSCPRSRSGRSRAATSKGGGTKGVNVKMG